MPLLNFVMVNIMFSSPLTCLKFSVTFVTSIMSVLTLRWYELCNANQTSNKIYTIWYSSIECDIFRTHEKRTIHGYIDDIAMQWFQNAINDI
jgi:hypothetical protein